MVSLFYLPVTFTSSHSANSFSFHTTYVVNLYIVRIRSSSLTFTSTVQIMSGSNIFQFQLPYFFIQFFPLNCLILYYFSKDIESITSKIVLNVYSMRLLSPNFYLLFCSYFPCSCFPYLLKQVGTPLILFSNFILHFLKLFNWFIPNYFCFCLLFSTDIHNNHFFQSSVTLIILLFLHVINLNSVPNKFFFSHTTNIHKHINLREHTIPEHFTAQEILLAKLKRCLYAINHLDWDKSEETAYWSVIYFNWRANG